MDLGLVYADTALVVLNKPAGLLAVPAPRGEDNLLARARERFADAEVVHRLDMATSGLMVMARGAAVRRTLGIAFERRQVDKRYVAVVAGIVEGDAGEVDLPLAADWPNRPLQRVDHEHGKPSLTRWHVLERDAAGLRTRLLLEPHTGRSHQLRVHLAAIGHPIVGDALYAGDAVRQAAPRLLLHATSLAFEHPLTRQPIRFDSPAAF